MIFLTEDDMRRRAVPKGGEMTLSAAERLTPSAMEYIREQRIRVVEGGSAQAAVISSPVPAPAPIAQEKPATGGAGKPAGSCALAGPIAQGMTHLDATNMVAKTHPRIEARGKLDSLMAAAVLVQTQYDPKGKLPGMLKDCLAEVKEWVFQSLAAEVSGSILPPQSMGGMDMEVLRAVSRNPRQYLQTDHLMPDASLGANIALLNWLRAQVRDAELAAAKAALCRTDIQESLNRLSSAVYVLMLLTHLAESGAGIPKL
ncbi:MAG: cobalamin adenosyltransferase [Deltaproteobacteria bacterium]|jgi:ethanolamine utilization cobalamin adenosyltransferase|nr:cobalamin adenosyltransferase [Deltaproteobacteria bacterium]